MTGSNLPARTRPGLLFVISAPSGAGKTSLCSLVREAEPDLRQSISYTTRPQRPGETDGVDYHFVSKARFEQMVAEEAFIEWAEVHGNCYGTARHVLEEARAAGVDLLLDIDFQGAAQLRESGFDGIFIFILPPSMAELQRRLTERDTDSAAVIAERMHNAREEIRQAVHFDYLIVNDELERAMAAVHAVILAEKHRTQRVLPGLPQEFGLKSKA